MELDNVQMKKTYRVNQHQLQHQLIGTKIDIEFCNLVYMVKTSGQKGMLKHYLWLYFILEISLIEFNLSVLLDRPLYLSY